MNRLGINLRNDLIAAGVDVDNNPMVFFPETGTVTFEDSVPQSVRTTVLTVIANHIPIFEDPDTIAARQYQKAKALFAMSPAQVSAWIDANINTFADAKDALKTLAIIVSVLGRGL